MENIVYVGTSSHKKQRGAIMTDKMFDVDVVITIAIPTQARSAGEAERLALTVTEYIQEQVADTGFEYSIKPVVQGVWL